VPESGIFDSQTQAALKQVQKQFGLECWTTGVINQETIDALNKAVAGVTEYGVTDKGIVSDSFSAEDKQTLKMEASFEGDVMEASLRGRLAEEDSRVQKKETAFDKGYIYPARDPNKPEPD
jgi:hypothetical protein